MRSTQKASAPRRDDDGRFHNCVDVKSKAR